MDFWLTDEQAAFRDSLQRYLAETYLPRRRLTEMSAAADFAVEQWPIFAQLGWLGAAFAEEVGGSGGSLIETALVLQEFGRALLPSPYLSTVGLAGHLLRAGGSAAQKERYLPQICAGTLRLACALGGEDVTGRAVGADYELTGEARVVADLPVAQQILVAARIAARPGHGSGLSLFLVPTDAAGVTMARCRLQDGRQAGDLRLAGVRVAAAQRLGWEGEVEALLAEAQDVGAALVAIEAAGALWALHDMTLEYLKTRKQFGQTLGSFQALQHRMVDIHTQCHFAQSLAMDAVAAIERDPPAARARAVAAAKVGVGQAARRVGEDAIQLHGGIGMTLEYAAGHYFKRLTAIRAAFGDERHHLARYAQLLRADANNP